MLLRKQLGRPGANIAWLLELAEQWLEDNSRLALS
jgi:hypothetical protein